MNPRDGTTWPRSRHLKHLGALTSWTLSLQVVHPIYTRPIVTNRAATFREVSKRAYRAFPPIFSFTVTGPSPCKRLPWSRATVLANVPRTSSSLIQSSTSRTKTGTIIVGRFMRTPRGVKTSDNPFENASAWSIEPWISKKTTPAWVLLVLLTFTPRGLGSIALIATLITSVLIWPFFKGLITTASTRVALDHSLSAI